MSSASGEQGGAAGAAAAQEQNDGELRAGRGGASGRSASPAKRSAADMEEGLDGALGDQVGDGGGGGGEGEVKTGFDDFVEQLRAESGEDAPDQMDTSSAEPPASSGETERPDKANFWNYSTEQIDEQVRKVTSLLAQPLDVGQKGAIVSCKWLSRVMSRSSEGLKSAKYPKEAREGSIGQVDNSDIVPDRAFDEPHLHDVEGRAFIPLKPGLVIDEDYQVFSHAAWGEVMASYGLMPGQYAIERYVRNTAPSGSTIENLQYETYPPTFTIRKVASRSPGLDESRQKTSSALDNLRQSKERQKRGQMSPDDAVRLVSSRQEKFQQFLKRSKEAAEIPLNHKVRIWRVLNPSNVAVDKPNTQPLTPQSREASPKVETKDRLELIVDKQSFKSMARGVDIDHLNVQDQTHNSNYNGNSDMEIHALTEDTTLIFEEVTTGPGGGEFASNFDANKTMKAGVMKRIESKPVSAATSGRTSPAPAGSIVTRGRQRRDGRTRGTIGLSNLGNTCYMNSALQCIRSVEELAVYFLSDLFKKEINTDNPLGHNGAMAKQYAVVLQGIYGDQVSGTFTPSAFKRTLGQSQPLFSGYGQQDSQEFLSFLVDALHEDLNRIHKKPYIENPDSDDNTVHDPNAIIELGETFRSNHAKRNDSVAMDLFNGFYKNTMECPECEKISITFDPFSLVTLQLPVESNFQHTVTFVPLRGKPVNHMIDMDKNSTLLAMKQTIASKHPGVSADRLWMIEVYSHKPFKQLDHSATLADASIQANDYIFVYELESRPSNAPTPAKKKLSMMFSSYSSRSDDEAPEMEDRRADRFAVPIMSRQKGRFGNNFEMLLHPMYITVTRDEAQDYEVILKKVLIAMAQLTSRPILTEFLPKDVAMTDAPAAATAAGETDENGQVSDRSVPSEDGYVEVSLDKESQESNGSTIAEAPKTDDDDRAPPANFMDATFQLPDELRNQLFKLKYAPSDRGMYCAGGMQSYKENGVRDMADRVKKPSRRSSVQSRSSDDSSTSTNSSSNSGGAPINGEVDDSATEIDDFETPDIVIGDQDTEQESYLAMPTPTANDDSDDDLSVTINQENTRQGRRKNNKKMHRGKNRRNQNAHPRKGWNARNKQNTFQSSYSASSRANPMDDDNPYYIKLGEGIIVDWFPEAFQQLFAGRANDANDERGHFLSHPDGKNLPYVIDPTVDEKKRQREERRKHGMTLEDCFGETGKRERLSEDNAWYCNRCKKLQQATKTLEIWTIPDILVVHLKRFGGNRSARDKIDTLVDYPITGLDMTKKVGKKEDGKEYLYDLFAVDNHFGGLGGGHYTAMAKNFYDGKWYDYNDSVCSKLGDRAIHSAAAYLLFYRRRSEAPLGPEYLQNLVLDFRNSQPGANNNPDTEDSDAAAAAAGEDQLGGPTSSPHQPRGSSSVSATTTTTTAATAGAGATARNARGFPGAGGAGAGTIAGSNLTTKGLGMGTTMAGMQSFSIEGPDQLAGQQSLLNAPSAEARSRLGSWNFDTLDDADDDAGGPIGKSSNGNGTGINGYGSGTAANTRLLLLRDRDAEAGDDEADETAVSDAAEVDSDNDRRDDDDDNDGDVTDFEGFQSGRVSPAVGDGDEDVGHWDDHALYSSAHDHDPQEGSVHSLHLHDAGNMGGDEAEEEQEDDDAHEIRLPKKSDHDDEEEHDDLLT